LGVRQTRGVVFPFRDYLQREQPDAVITSMWPFTVATLMAHRLANSRARIATWEHSTISVQYANRGFLHDQLLRKTIAHFYPMAHERVAVSAGVADDLAELSGLPRQSFTVISNPMPLVITPKPPAEVTDRIWDGWKGPRIVTVGRLKAPKNHAFLLRAFKKLLAKLDARLMIVGEGELTEETKALARSEGIADKVFFPGPTIDPLPYYHSADLFVLSSTREGSPTVIIEALACGLPVVSTECRSGPAEILEKGRYGKLTPVGDMDALADAMIESLHAQHDPESLKRRAADFEPHRIADQFFRLLFPTTEKA